MSTYSVITSVLNAVGLLQVTADSIRNQKFACQWIVVDGGSTDGIEEFCNSNKDIISHYIPGPDTGIYNAWNKALKYVEGEWVVFLGAGDAFVNGDVLYNAQKMLNDLPSKYEIAYGNIFLIAENTGQVLSHDVKVWSEIQGKTHFLLPVLPSHAGVFHRRSLFDRVGRFDDSYKIAADSKMQLQAMLNGDFCYLGIDVSNVQAGGVSFKAENHHRIFTEHWRIAKELGIHTNNFSIIKGFLNAKAKHILFRILGKKASYRLFDMVRMLNGLDKKWG
jgi:glycosyltransferase involved in cell wall biosynthesis